MMKKIALALMAACLMAGSAAAQAGMTLDDFVSRANRIPLNATAMLRPDAHRLKGEAERAFRTVGTEIQTARTAGRTPPACPPERINLDVRQLLAFLNGIPEARRERMTVTDGIRAWMRSRYPCAAG
ncbi:MAG: hypothetical protein KKA37_10750 [Alphaproteobacteria bacterium]|jgi:hypothetical protein|nr:hypothetical protein [Alphaproteobacteria bacterium]MBU2042470.1 hypothetical protein [Alphaproteobacteria bacterium]MBU2126302.1 hypothetical protein [Alphaproteobacteria bacterium]MBU2207324.1 hypothetical protein [Alphaproteobacteria bacterium]